MLPHLGNTLCARHTILLFVQGRSSGCRMNPRTDCGDRRGQPRADNSRSHFLSLSVCKLSSCVQTVLLCHDRIGHTYFTQEMKVFLWLVTSASLCLVKMTSETWPEESNYHHSVHILAHHVIARFCGCGPNFVSQEGQSKDFCVRVCVFTKHESTRRRLYRHMA